MRLLLCLAEHAGDVVSIDDLLSEVWAGVIVTPDSVYQAVASLRRQLGDDARQPAYIVTVPRLGYRLIAKVSAILVTSTDAISARVTKRAERGRPQAAQPHRSIVQLPPRPSQSPPTQTHCLIAGATALCVALVAAAMSGEAPPTTPTPQ